MELLTFGIMVSPDFLKRNDTIGIVAPAKFIAEKEFIKALDILKEWGLKIKIGKYVNSQHNTFAGTDEQRAADFQEMLDNRTIKAILCVRGGYGTIKIIEKLNFKKFITSPKWIIGYSDITILHAYINSVLKINTLHATMPLNFKRNTKNKESLESLRKVLFGEKVSYELKGSSLNRQGNVKGILVGGNLSVLYSLLGTNYELNTDDKILFIEDVDEYLYHIDRMMISLKLSNKLKNLKGLIVGYLSNMHDNKPPFGKTAKEIIFDAIKEYNFPVCFNFPAGHKDPNLALMMGSEINLSVNKNKVALSFSQV